MLDQVAIVAPTDSTVLLHGETGTGKELIARAIHNLSSRRERTFVRMNCAAIPSGLLESELFGHEKGAFTGALMQRKGRFELADGGSLFLDEIGDISLELQPKLLRAMQEQEFERLGSAKTIQVNVRMIAATHRDLSAMIREQEVPRGSFLSIQRFPDRDPAAAGTARGHSAPGELFCVKGSGADAETDKVHPQTSDGNADELSVEGQHQGIGKLHRTSCHSYTG